MNLTLRKSGSGVPIPVSVEAPSDDVFGLIDEITTRVKEEMDLTPEQIRGDTDRPVAEVSMASIDALRAYREGLEPLRQGESRRAIEPLQEATRLDPSFAMAYAKLAEAYIDLDDYHEAEAASDRAVSLAEAASLPLAERYQIHATGALIAEDYDEAVESYQDLVELFPDDPDLQFKLASTYEEAGHLPDAVEAYQRVVEMAPDYGAALLGLGRVQVMSGQPGEAIDSLEASLETGQFDGNPQALGMIHSIIGVAHRETGDLEASIEHLNLSLEHRREAGNKGGQAATLSNLGTVYRRKGDIDKAIEATKGALSIAQEMGNRAGESNYLVQLGMTYLVGEDLDKALSEFRDSMQIEMERQDPVSLANRLDKIADIYRLRGQYDDAIIYLEQAKSYLAKTGEKREKALNYNYIGLVRKSQGLYEQASEAFLAALPLFQEIHHETGAAYCHQDLADIYASQGRYADAFDSLLQSLAIHQGLGVAHEIAEVKAPLGRLLITLGQLEEAEKALNDAERLAAEGHGHGSHSESGSPLVLFGRAELAGLRGQQDAAAEAYERANFQANISKQKEIAVESRVKLGLLYLRQGKLPNARRLLERTRQEAADARLRPLESSAASALARVYLAEGEPDRARVSAIEAIDIAENFSGRPILYEAKSLLGKALIALNREPEGLDAYSEAAEIFTWIRESLRPEQVEAFVAKPDVQTFLVETVAGLDAGGRGSEAAKLRNFLAASGGATSENP